jgi:hypothetical protein
MERYDVRKQRSEQDKLITGQVEDEPVSQVTEKAPLTFTMKLKLQGVSHIKYKTSIYGILVTFPAKCLDLFPQVTLLIYLL